MMSILLLIWIKCYGNFTHAPNKVHCICPHKLTCVQICNLQVHWVFKYWHCELLNIIVNKKGLQFSHPTSLFYNWKIAHWKLDSNYYGLPLERVIRRCNNKCLQYMNTTTCKNMQKLRDLQFNQLVMNIPF
jgi:hypothetical protein